MTLLLELKQISYTYPGEKIPALNNLSLKLCKGEKVAVLGRNGAGKSTLFLNSNGVYFPDEGDIFLKEEKILHNKKSLNNLRKTIGLVFQDPDSQFIAPNVEAEISFGLLNSGISMEETKKKIRETAEVLSINHLLEKSTYSLSGGEKKIVSIASVLAMNPEIILFDEPTAGIDYINILKFKESLEVLEKENISIVISTHDIDFTWDWAERVIIMSKGKIVADGKTEEILTDLDLLKEYNLNPPSLVTFSNVLKSKNLLDENYPKTFEELNLLIKNK